VVQKANVSFKNKFPYISVIDEASDFKFGMQLGFVKAHHKITRSRKGVHGPGLAELPKIWGFFFNIYTQRLKLATSNLVHSLGLPRPIIKSHPEEKVGVALSQGSSSKFWGSPVIFLQRLGLATSHLACT